MLLITGWSPIIYLREFIFHGLYALNQTDRFKFSKQKNKLSFKSFKLDKSIKNAHSLSVRCDRTYKTETKIKHRLDMIWNLTQTALQDKHQRVRYNATKVPLLPNGNSAKTNDSTTWSSFQDVIKAFLQNNSEQCTGIDFVFTGANDVVGIHIGDRLNNKQLNTAAGSYTTRVEWNYNAWSRPTGDWKEQQLITC